MHKIFSFGLFLLMAGMAVSAPKDQEITFAEANKAFAGTERNISLEPISLLYHPNVGLYIVQANIMGKPCNLLLDTGATHTTFNINWIKKNFPDVALQPIQVHGSTNVKQLPHVFIVSEFKLGKSVLKNFYAMSVDLSQVVQSFAPMEIHGILGMSTLGVQPWKLSHKDKTFSWVDLDKIENKKEIPIKKPYTGHIFVELASTKGKKFWALLDSGASYTFVPKDCWVGESGENVGLNVTDIQSKAGDNGQMLMKGKMDKLIFTGGFEVPNVSPFFSAPGSDPLFGSDSLKKVDVVMDCNKAKLYLIAR